MFRKIRKMTILQERYNAFLDKHRSVLEENKPFVQVCHHGLKRQRGHWSIELFQSKRCAIQLAAERSGRKAGSSKGKWRDDKEKGYQEQSQSSWGKQKWRPDEEDGDGDTPQPRSNKGASDHWSKSRSDWSSMFFLEHRHHCLRGESFLQYVHCLSVQSLNIGMIYIMRWRVEAEGP